MAPLPAQTAGLPFAPGRDGPVGQGRVARSAYSRPPSGGHSGLMDVYPPQCWRRHTAEAPHWVGKGGPTDV
jgi:hypothetical protein